ncbi:MAG: sugar O-acetyltransferase, partial [Clostridiaceae bacterium]|nr:sugar O-acetyltransferase [Clostridiaceae bacterium]
SPFRCDYGENIFIGDKSFINFNVSMIDLGKIKIGNRVLIGPGTGLFTAIHPTDPEIRATGIEKGVDITIEDDVRIGGNATILPRVTIGKGSIIGAGSVVTKDIPKMTIAVGNPAKVIREITEEDKIYWQGQYDEYLRELGE